LVDQTGIEEIAMGHPNEDLIRSYVGAFARGDLESARSYLGDDITYHVGGRHPLAGDYHGKDAVLDFFRQRSARTEGTFRVEPHDLLANDAHGVALSNVTVERDGRRYAWNVVTVYHLAQGKVVECWIQDSDQYLADEALR
jgi:ketosteroid isomerase-like protein